MNKPYGYSLAELLIALAIFAITASAAAPAMQQMVRSNERAYALNQMLMLLGHTRSSAVFQRREAVLCPGRSDCQSTLNWAGELLIFHDHNANRQRDADEPILRHEQLPKDYSWYWASFRKLDHIVYQRDGTARAANGTLTLCYKGQPQQQLVINVTGRVRRQAADSEASCR